MPDGLSSLSDDEPDLVAGDHHLEEASAASTAAMVRLVWARGAAMGSVTLVGNDVLDGSLGSPVQKTKTITTKQSRRQDKALEKVTRVLIHSTQRAT